MIASYDRFDSAPDNRQVLQQGEDVSIEQERAAILRLLMMLTTGLGFGLSLITMIVAFISRLEAPFFRSTLIYMLLIAATAIGVWLAARRKKNQLAINIYLYGNVIITTFLVITSGMAESPALLSFAPVIVSAGVLGRRRESIGFTIYTIVLFIVCIILQNSTSFGSTAAMANTPLWVRNGATLVWSGIVLTYIAYTWSQSTRKLIQRQSQQATEIYQTNQSLLEKNIQQVELGSDLSQSASSLLNASHEQASGATQQASAVSEVSTTIEELGSTARQIAMAAEVKSLANRALSAAKEVKGVIAEIQQATNSAVLAAEEGGKEVQRGVALAHSAGELMNEIVMAAERTAQSGAEISLATAQQQSASDQVVETMREIADVARRTATGSRKVQESAQRLTMIANRLHGLSSVDNN